MGARRQPCASSGEAERPAWRDLSSHQCSCSFLSVPINFLASAGSGWRGWGHGCPLELGTWDLRFPGSHVSGHGGGAWEGLGARLSDIHDPMRPRVLGLAGALGWGSQGREGQENAVQGGVPWSLGPVLEAESLQNRPTKRMFAQGGEGAMSLPKPCPSLPRWAACRSTGFGDGDTHARTHARARLDFQPCFYDSVTGPVTGPLLNLGFCVSLAESRLGMSSASHHGADVLRGPG